MKYFERKPKKHAGKKWVLALVIVVILVAAGLLYWHRYHKPAAQAVTKAGNFASGSSGSSDNSSSPKKPTSNAGRTIGGGTDTKGQASASTNPSQWIVSKSGNITVEQPIANATLQNGSTLSGTAKVSTLNFRLIDNSVGVVSEGTLSVVDGKFSGKLAFTSHSSSGQLDVFSTNSTGAELNEIQIAVRF